MIFSMYNYLVDCWNENHLFLARLLAVVLYWLSPRGLYSTLIIALI
jgi:hypothetical protein